MRALLLLLAFALVSPALAEVSEAQARVERLLQAHHATPSRVTLEAEAGPEAGKLLQAIAVDAEALPPVRAAALDALRAWPDAHTFALYTAALAPEQPRALRHKVLSYLPVFGARAVAPLTEALRGDDRQIARTAAHALFQVDDASADKALRDAATQVDPSLRPLLLGLLSKRAAIR